MGQLAKKTVVFELTGEKILDANDKVGNKHISQVQKIVQKKLESLENELKDQRGQELEDLKMQGGTHQGRRRSADGSPALPVGGSDFGLGQPVFARSAMS